MKIKKSRQKKLSASNPSAQNQQANDLSPMSVTEEQKLVDQVLVASSSAKPSEQAVESEDDNFAQRKLVEAEEEKEPSEQAVLAGKSSALTSSEVTTIKELTNAEAAQALSVDGDSLMTDALAEEGAGSEGAGSSAPAAASAVTTESFGKQHPNESGLGILALLAAGGAIAVAAAGGGGGGAAVPAPAPLPIGPRVSGIALPVATATTTNPVWFPVNALQPAVDGDLAITAVPFRQGAANNVIAGAAVASRLPSATATGVSYYNAGDVMTFTVTMSENVTVTGIPQLAINIGGTRVMANYAAGTGTAVLTFVYTVSAGQNDMNGVSIDANSLSLNSGSIVSAAANNGVPAGTAASLAHDAMMDNANYIVDTTLPVPNVPVLALPSSTVAGIEMGMVSGYQAQGRVTTATGGTFGVAAAATVDAPQGVMPAQNSQAGAITINAEKDSLVTLDFSRIAADGTTLRTVRKNVVATGASQAVDLTAAELTTLGSGMVTTLGYDVIQVKVVRSVDLAGNPSDLASISVNNDNSANGVIRFKLDTVAPTLLLAAAPLQQLTQIALSRPAIATVASLQDLAAGVAIHQWTDLVSSDPLTTHSTHSATALTQIATLNNINQYILTFTPPVASVISTPLVAISHALADTALTIVDSVGLVESSVSTRFNPTNNPTVTYTYRFSEKVIGLTFEDFTVVQTASDGTRINPISLNASNLVSSGDGKTYTLTVTPAPVTYQTDNDTLSVTLGAGAVIDAAGNPNALAIQTVKTIDTIAPVATTVAVTAGSGVNNASWYNVGDVLTITLTMDEAVKVVTGTPQLTIGLDGVVSVGARHGLIGLSDPSLKTVQASYASAVPHAANQLVFTYAIKAGDNTDNGVNIAAHALSLNGASITDVAGNAINLSGNAVFPAANVMANSNANFKIDTTAPVAPTLTLVTDTGFSGSDGLTSNATINVRGLELGSVANPWTGTTWQYQVDGGSWATGTGASFTASNGAHSYSVVQVDEAGNTSAVSAVAVYTLDTTVPTVSSVALTTFTDNDPLSPATPKVLGVGDVVTATVTMSEAVTVTGMPELALLVGSTTRAASYVAGSGTNRLTFTYVIDAVDTDSNGISIAANALTLNPSLLGGGSIEDLAGNAIATNSPVLIGGRSSVTSSAVADNANFKVDTVISTPTLALASDTGTSQSDGISTNPTISITGLEQGATWQYAVDGVWTTVNAIDSNGGNTFTFLASAGRHSYSARQVDAAGNVGTAVSRSLLIDHVMPTVSNIALSGGGGANLLIAGSVVTATVTMSEEVTVTGTPQLGLTIGNSVYFATYSSGTGSQNLIFTYAILSGQVDSNGISVAVNSLRLNNGVITDLAGNNAVLLQSFSLPDDGNFRVDAVLPTVAGIALTTSTDNLPLSTATPKVLGVGDVVTATVTMSETVTVTGTPQLALLVGGATRAASYVAGSGTNSLTFTYVIVAGDTDNNGISIAANALSLNGGTIVDMANNAASLVTAIVVADNPSFKVDTTAPTTPALALAVDTGASDGITSNPTINVTGLEQGATWQYALDGGSWVTVDPITSNGGSAFSFLASAGSHTYTMRQADTAGNVSVTSAALSVTFDNIPPTVSGVALTASTDTAPLSTASPKILGVGDVVTATVTMSEVVTVTGVPTLGINLGGTTKQASFAAGSGTNSLAFTYVIVAGDTDSNGISISAGSLTVPVGASILDGAGNAATPAFTATAADNANFKVITTAPSVSSVALTGATDNTPLSIASPKILGVGDVVTATVTMGDVVVVSGGTPTLALQVGSATRAASYVAGSGTNSLTFTYVIVGGAAGDTDSNGISIAAGSLTLGGATINDLAGNAATLAFTATAADNVNFRVDTTAPVAPTTLAQGIASNGFVAVQSAEVGVAYLVNSSVSVTSASDITNALDSLWNSVQIPTMNQNVNLQATGLQVGTYKVYTQDAAGNLSLASTNDVVIIDTPASVLDLGTINVGTVATPINVNLRLIAPVITATGKVYYYLDQNQAGGADSGDSLAHSTLDSLLNDENSGADTTAADAATRSRTVTANGLTKTIVLPTVAELLDLYNSPISHPPVNWQSSSYWAADLGSAAGNHMTYSLVTGGATGTSAVDTLTNFVAFQVL